MTELRKVNLTELHANPFRDIENYPFWRDKLDRLKESMRSTGAWPNIIVRQREDGEYELAFGHHRLQAFKELVEEGAAGFTPQLEVLVQPLQDEAMLKMMADENAEEFGTNFMLGTMNALGASVRAFAEGKVAFPALAWTERARTDTFRAAPSFIQGSATPASTTVYTAESLGQFLGWMQEEGTKAQARVYIGLAALELVELGVCKANAFQGLGFSQARAVVQQAQLVYKARMRELDKKAEEKELKRAREEGRKQAAAAVKASVEAIRDGAGIKELKEETRKIRTEVQSSPQGRGETPKGVDLSRVFERLAGEVEDFKVKFTLWAERGEKLWGLYMAGAICDSSAEKAFFRKLEGFEREIGRFAQKMGKLREGRG